MKAITQKKYHELQEFLRKTYDGVPGSTTFAASPSVQQTLHDAITHRSDFLGRINTPLVDELVGQKIIGGTNGSVTGRTNTATPGNPRQPKNALALATKSYSLSETDSDVFLLWSILDQWAKFPNFAQKYSEWVQRQIALDKIKIGFHGTSIAENTDMVANPNLQDVNKGWIQLAREFNGGSQVFDEGSKVAGKIQIGETGDYKNLDGLVHDLSQLIAEEHAESGDLVAIVGRGLLSNDKAKLYDAVGATPTEKERVETRQVINTYGGLPAFTVPFFPATGLVITSWDNLSIYTQEGSWRRSMKQQEEYKRQVDWNSRNEGYVIEDETKFACIEPDNIQFV
jgi:P2 family phage major capsid protein